MRLLLVLFFISFSAVAQESLDSLHRLLSNHVDDSGKVDILNRIAFLNLAHSLDTMELYAHKAITLGEELQYLRGVAEGYKNLGTAYYAQGSYSLGLEQLFEALKISERIHDRRSMARVLHNIGATYFYQEDYNRALDFTKRSIELFKAVEDVEGVATAQLSTCECYKNLNKPDEALSYCEEARKYFERTRNKERQGHAMLYLGVYIF